MSELVCVGEKLNIIISPAFISRSEFHHVLLYKILGFMLNTVSHHKVLYIAAVLQFFGQDEMSHLSITDELGIVN